MTDNIRLRVWARVAVVVILSGGFAVGLIIWIQNMGLAVNVTPPNDASPAEIWLVGLLLGSFLTLYGYGAVAAYRREHA